jgi:hypothetical protein
MERLDGFPSSLTGPLRDGGHEQLRGPNVLTSPWPESGRTHEPDPILAAPLPLRSVSRGSVVRLTPHGSAVRLTPPPYEHRRMFGRVLPHARPVSASRRLALAQGAVMFDHCAGERQCRM